MLPGPNPLVVASCSPDCAPSRQIVCTPNWAVEVVPIYARKSYSASFFGVVGREGYRNGFVSLLVTERMQTRIRSAARILPRGAIRAASKDGSELNDTH